MSHLPDELRNGQNGAKSTSHTTRVFHRDTARTIRRFSPSHDASSAPTTALDLASARTTVHKPSAGYTAVLNEMLSVERQDGVAIRVEHVFVLLLLALILVLRLQNLDFNTLHLDEAIYTTVGEEVTAGVFTQGATSWMYGSYLYPLAATTAEQIGGVVGLRLLSAVLSTVTAFFVFLAAQRVFGLRAAALALLIFGLSGISVNVGQMATYDALSLPFFAASLYFAVSALMNPEKQRRHLFWAGITFSLSVLSKYIALLLLPALIMVMLVLHLAQKRSLWSFIKDISWGSALIPMIIILGIYGAFFRQDLFTVFTADYAVQTEPRLKILGEVFQQVGVHAALTVAAFVVIATELMQRFQGRNRGLLALLLLCLPVLFVTLMMLPVYHVATANGRSMWKHNVFTLVLLSPIIGYSFAKLTDYFRAPRSMGGRLFRYASAAFTAFLLFWFVWSAFRQNEAFHRSWPDSQPVIEFMRTQNIGPDSRILASGYSIYDYYFDYGVADRGVWNNIWFYEHNGASGAEGVRRAIADCAFDMIVLDNYWAPEWGGELMFRVEEAGYAPALSTTDQISTGDQIMTNVYLPTGNCQRGQAQ